VARVSCDFWTVFHVLFRRPPLLAPDALDGAHANIADPLEISRCLQYVAQPFLAIITGTWLEKYLSEPMAAR
jgi:hypothetical protein